MKRKHLHVSLTAGPEFLTIMSTDIDFGQVVKVDDESEIAMTEGRTGGVPPEICNVK